jgi:hypothetical protein
MPDLGVCRCCRGRVSSEGSVVPSLAVSPIHVTSGYRFALAFAEVTKFKIKIVKEQTGWGLGGEGLC